MHCAMCSKAIRYYEATSLEIKPKTGAHLLWFVYNVRVTKLNRKEGMAAASELV